MTTINEGFRIDVGQPNIVVPLTFVIISFISYFQSVENVLGRFEHADRMLNCIGVDYAPPTPAPSNHHIIGKEFCTNCCFVFILGFLTVSLYRSKKLSNDYKGQLISKRLCFFQFFQKTNEKVLPK